MAIKFKEINDKFYNEPLKQDELQVIKEVEDYIDKQINNQYKGEPIYVNLDIVNFKRTLSLEFGRNIPDARRKMMYNELINRYHDAGWLTCEQLGEDDGPFRPAIDYWVLKGPKTN